MRNYSVVMQQFDKICSCCREPQGAALSQLQGEGDPGKKKKKKCNHKGAIKLQSREKWPIKYKETEVLMIYCGWGIISEEREGTAEVKNDPPSGSQGAGG